MNLDYLAGRAVVQRALGALIFACFMIGVNRSAGAEPVRIGLEARLADNPRSHYSRYVNWRPADGEVVQLNPPRISWPYWPDWPGDWSESNHTFRLQIASTPDCVVPVLQVDCPYNFYIAIPELKGAKTWYWRVGYDPGTPKEKWSPVRSFAVAEDAVVWDRAVLADPKLAQRGHPRVLFNADNLEQIRRLGDTNPASAAALKTMRAQADKVINSSWWRKFPKTDRTKEPKIPFHVIAEDLATVCFVWKMTGDVAYAGVKDRAVTWASYPPGGRSSPENLGGDGNENATQGNEFLALLFDWLYQDLSDAERRVMIRSLEWRVDHIMNNFVWGRKKGRNSGVMIRPRSLSGMTESHQVEASMDTAVCGLVLYEHSAVGRLWYELISSYLAGVTCGHGFDEAWNEGPGYGTSKFKWLTLASLYFDTAIAGANFGKNPFYSRMGEYFSRVIPVGMPHNAWGNQNNASRGNHLATFRKLAYLTGDGRLLGNWQEYGGRQVDKFRPWIEYVLPYYYKEPTPRPEDDPVGLFPIDGWGMAATGPPSLRKTYIEGAGVIFQCRPRGGFSHSFYSDASFILHASGQMLNHGGGSSANKDPYAYHAMSHNTVLVDGVGQAQMEQSQKHNPDVGQIYPEYGRMVGFARGDGAAGAPTYVYFCGDATRCYPAKPGAYQRWGLAIAPLYNKGPLSYLERFVRHVLFVRDKYFVIFDDLASSQPATYTWLYHILPDSPLRFDEGRFVVDYKVGDVEVRLQHVAHPGELKLEDRQGLDAMVNPITGEDYRKGRKGDILCGHNLWVSNSAKAKAWQFLTVIYPTKRGAEVPEITRIDDRAVRVGKDVICFDPRSDAARGASIVIDPAAMR